MASLSQYYISVAFQHAHPAAAAATRSPAAAWQQLTHGYSKLSSRTLSVASHPHWLRLRGCEETLRAVLARLVHILPIGARHRRLRTTASFDASWQASTVKHHTKWSMERSVVAPKSSATQKRIIQNFVKAPLRRACQETLRVHLVSPIELYAGTSKEKDVTDSDEIVELLPCQHCVKATVYTKLCGCIRFLIDTLKTSI